MPDVRVNSSAYKIGVVRNTDLTGTPVFTNVEGITGFSVEDNSQYRSIRALGDAGNGKWQKMVRETLGITITVTVDQIVDDSDDSLAAGQDILRQAASATTTSATAGNVIGVQLTHANGSKTTTGLFSVHGGSLGLGSGGSDGSFNTNTYRLVSHGVLTTT